jgi:hypothetical protein
MVLINRKTEKTGIHEGHELGVEKAGRDHAKYPVVSLAQPARAGDTQKPLPRPAGAGSTTVNAFFDTLQEEISNFLRVLRGKNWRLE